MAKPTIFIETNRLWLRPFTQADLHPFTAMRGNPAVARYQSWSNFTEADGYLFICEMEQATPGTPGEWYQYAIALRGSNQFIGDCALFTSEDGRFGEIGYSFDPAHQRQGYATEAVTAVLHYAFTHLNLQKIKAIADDRNTPSINLLQRLGFRQQKQETIWFKGEYIQENHYTISQAKWAAQGTPP